VALTVVNSSLVANFGELCIGGMQLDSLSVVSDESMQKNSTYEDGCVDDGTQSTELDLVHFLDGLGSWPLGYAIKEAYSAFGPTNNGGMYLGQ
jgi:hypothetical protein